MTKMLSDNKSTKDLSACEVVANSLKVMRKLCRERMGKKLNKLNVKSFNSHQKRRLKSNETNVIAGLSNRPKADRGNPCQKFLGCFDLKM